MRAPTSRPLRVLFAPDYRKGIQYQHLLAEALSQHGVNVEFLSDYRRVLPLARGSTAAAPDIVHLHWPEAYFGRRGDLWDRLRVLRYPFDYWLIARRTPIVVTAHNLLPHNRGDETGVFRNIRITMQNAAAVFAHAEPARKMIAETFAVPDDLVEVIPFGDHAVTLGEPLDRDEAARALGLPLREKVCLMFGTVSPYKGISEVVRFWSEARVPYRLVVVGPVILADYADAIRAAAGGAPTIDLRLSPDWLDDEALRTWLSAVDCVIFNYKSIFTSGAGALARSFGVPSILPRSAATLDLGEPHIHVFRFDALQTDFRDCLERALATPCDYAQAEDWRWRTSWDAVAARTAPVYRRVMREARA
jgi:glycosyltransferase involved in cell wall biosynthesis